MTRAEEFFEARSKYEYLLERIEHALLVSCGINPHKEETWPFPKIIYDDYDDSFEFRDVQLDWTPTPKQLAACWQLGFKRCWICYTDGSEKYFYDTTP
jgi:hypothetical protein